MAKRFLIKDGFRFKYTKKGKRQVSAAEIAGYYDINPVIIENHPEGDISEVSIIATMVRLDTEIPKRVYFKSTDGSITASGMNKPISYKDLAKTLEIPLPVIRNHPPGYFSEDTVLETMVSLDHKSV